MSDTNKKLVALTFDDGPSTLTPKVLDILEENGVVATFFLIGNLVTEDKKSIMERQIKMGCELANHSFTHSDMTKMTAAEIQEEIDKTTKIIKDMAGYDVKFFRPPYIALNDTMYDAISLPFIEGLGCYDWEPDRPAEERLSIVLNEVQDGTMVLLHDFEDNIHTVEALPEMIAGLKEKGYSFVTVSQLFEQKKVNPNVKHKIWTNVYY